MEAGSHYDVITFDCYGTLIDWESGIVEAFRSEAAREGLDLHETSVIQAYMSTEPVVEAEGYTLYREVLAVTATRVCAELGWSLNPSRAEFLAESVPNWQPFPDTNAALERLATRFELGILSNIDDDLLEATRMHLTVAFEPVVTAQQVRSYKPGFAHFNEARSRLAGKRQLHAAQSYYHDVVPASRLGVPVAWVNRRKERLEEGAVLPTCEVNNLTELADLLGV
jgi:2-haloacid dehalogenase/putative hydrolase of the HAD superfamily